MTQSMIAPHFNSPSVPPCMEALCVPCITKEEDWTEDTERNMKIHLIAVTQFQDFFSYFRCRRFAMEAFQKRLPYEWEIICMPSYKLLYILQFYRHVSACEYLLGGLPFCWVVYKYGTLSKGGLTKFGRYCLSFVLDPVCYLKWNVEQVLPFFSLLFELTVELVDAISLDYLKNKMK